MSLELREDEAVRRATGGAGRSPVLLTVEHASNRLPERWSWQGQEWLAATHWAWDLGIEPLTDALAATLGARSVGARFSRLLVDPNRELESETLFRTRADGHAVALNATLDAAESARRIDGYYRPYHAAIEAELQAGGVDLILAMHSFTPLYEGTPREVEIGVLHAGDQAGLAARWREILGRGGRDVRVDEPYSGAGGFMYSGHHHAVRHGLPCLELEIRQDLLEDDAHYDELLALIATALRDTGFSP